jgi:hypothetical protein
MSVTGWDAICTQLGRDMYAIGTRYVRRPNLLRLNTSTTQKEKNGLTITY